MVDPDLVEINEITDFIGYLQSIDWTDPWLIGLIAFHITTTTTAVLTRNRGNFQIFLFLMLLLLVYCSESINEFAADNWKTFSKQQYFDSKGLFISVVFSMPILLTCMIMVGSWLYQSTQTMAALKTLQLKEKLKRENSIKQNLKSD